jgi:hypothetical protein
LFSYNNKIFKKVMADDWCGAIGGTIGWKTEVLGEILPHCSFVNHKTRIT